METNFFSVLASLEAKGEWTVHIKQEENGNMTVSSLFTKPCGDKASKLIPPLTFPSKTAPMLDSIFFKDLSQASSAADKVLSSMEHYLKEVEKANKASAGEQKKNAETKKVATPKLSKYEEGLKQAEELEKQGKYSEAWTKVPDPTQYPDQAEFLRKRREELSQKFAPNLFGEVEDGAASKMDVRVTDEANEEMPPPDDDLPNADDDQILTEDMQGTESPPEPEMEYDENEEAEDELPF